jgi:tricorn protease
MLSIFQQSMPFTTLPRNGPEGYPHDRLPTVPWDRPVAVLCNENTYSNSEIFCHAFRAARRGPLIGTPTAGGVISAVMSDIPGLGKLQIPFRTWMDRETRTSLDLNGAQPTHPIGLTPSDEDEGLDPQLEKALELILQAHGHGQEK